MYLVHVLIAVQLCSNNVGLEFRTGKITLSFLHFRVINFVWRQEVPQQWIGPHILTTGCSLEFYILHAYQFLSFLMYPTPVPTSICLGPGVCEWFDYNWLIIFPPKLL